MFSAKSVLYLSQLSFCLKKLLTLFGATTKSHPNDEVNKTVTTKLYKIEEFELLTEIDTVNIFKLLEFVKTSKLTHKLQGFVEQYGNSIKINEQKIKKSGITEFLNSIKNKDTLSQGTASIADIAENNEEQMSNPLMAILNFLECLKSRCIDGRICVLPGAIIGQGIIKFLLLNPATHFHDIGTCIEYLFNTSVTYICFIFIPIFFFAKLSERCQISSTGWWHNGTHV